jgi:hypothetical protein
LRKLSDRIEEEAVMDSPQTEVVPLIASDAVDDEKKKDDDEVNGIEGNKGDEVRLSDSRSSLQRRAN